MFKYNQINIHKVFQMMRSNSLQLEISALKQENFQLKNQLTDLKNGFDLNRDVLKILEQNVKQSQPRLRIFYQIISRLTGVNNQVMISNVQLIQEKNIIKVEKMKMEAEIQNLNDRIQELTQNLSQLYKPKQIYFQLKDEIKSLRDEIVSINEDDLRKNYMINHLEKKIKEIQLAELKKPIIPTYSEKIMLTEEDLKQIPKKYISNEEKRYECLYKEVKKQNRRLLKIIQELEYRLTLFASLYNIEPPSSMMKHENPKPEKTLDEEQLNLLMFALNGLQITEQSQDNFKVTIKKRFNKLEQQSKNQEIKKCHSLHNLH